jgi:hypothetical protein
LYIRTGNYPVTMKNLSIILVLMLLIPLYGWSQKTSFTILFEGIGDNREFSSGRSFSQTILGTRGSFEAGVTQDGHNLRAGVTHMFEFGSVPEKPAMILYYQYEDPEKTFHFGSFPRKSLVDFPLALLADTINYYRPNIEGLRGELRWNNGHQNIFVDWTGRQSPEVRESFSAAASGEITLSRFSIRNFILLNHLAHSRPRGAGEHVNDNLGYSVVAGWRNEKRTTWHGSISAGILGSVFRERSVSDQFIHSISFMAEGYLKHRNFAVNNIAHAGDGHLLLTGDPFYKLNGYMRTDAIWYFINHDRVSGRFNLSFHLIEWQKIDQSQQISIIYRLP